MCIYKYSPKELEDLFGFNPVVELSSEDPARHMLEILGSLEKYQPLADRARAKVNEMGGFDPRAAEMLRVIDDRRVGRSIAVGMVGVVQKGDFEPVFIDNKRIKHLFLNFIAKRSCLQKTLSAHRIDGVIDAFQTAVERMVVGRDEDVKSAFFQRLGELVRTPKIWIARIWRVPGQGAFEVPKNQIGLLKNRLDVLKTRRVVVPSTARLRGFNLRHLRHHIAREHQPQRVLGFAFRVLGLGCTRIATRPKQKRRQKQP